MQVNKIISSLFAVLGTAILVVSIVLCLVCRNLEPMAQSTPQEALDARDAFAASLSAGDLEGAAMWIYGQPELGGDTALQSAAASRIWEAFRSSLSVEADGICYLEGRDYCQDVTVTMLDVPGLMKALPDHVKPSVPAAEEAPLPDEDQLLMEAVEEALAAGELTQVQGRLRLVEDGGRWYVVPDKTVLAAISGGLG